MLDVEAPWEDVTPVLLEATVPDDGGGVDDAWEVPEAATLLEDTSAEADVAPPLLDEDDDDDDVLPSVPPGAQDVARPTHSRRKRAGCREGTCMDGSRKARRQAGPRGL